MVNIEKLIKYGFFEQIPQIKELGDLCGIKDIFVIPHIISKDILYLMITTHTGTSCDVRKFFEFSDTINRMFENHFELHVYKKDGLEEAIAEDSIFSEAYENALRSGILINQLRKDMSLDLQWTEVASRAKKQNGLTQNTSETLKQDNKTENLTFSLESFNKFKGKENPSTLKRRIDQFFPEKVQKNKKVCLNPRFGAT